jgi:hypothetical protein
VGLLLSAGYALGADLSAPTAPNAFATQSQSTAANTSGRPTAVLNDDQCQEVWSKAAAQGDTLSADQAKPYVVNFMLTDTDGDGKISSAVFKEGCKKGLVQMVNDDGRTDTHGAMQGSTKPGG